MALGEVICEPGDALMHGYFPVDSFISLPAVDAEKAVLEVGMTGREGMSGGHMALGLAPALLRALMQAAGLGLRIPCVALKAELEFSRY